MLDIPGQFSAIIALVRAAFSAYTTQVERAEWPVVTPARLALAMLLGNRLNAMAGRFARLFARYRAGARLHPRPPKAPRKPRATPAQPYQRLSAAHGWLTATTYQVRAGGAHLQHLLAEPDMAQFLAAVPQAGRILRPLCRMLAVPLPPVLALPPRPPRPRPPKAAPPPAEPPRRGKYPRFNPRTYSPGRIPAPIPSLPKMSEAG